MDFQLLYDETKNLDLLFVEDYAELRENSIEILDNYFAYCEGAVDGKAGLEQYSAYYKKKKKYFDLIITDIKMPEMDGITLVEEIYKINPQQPIIVLSAHHESEYLLTLINIGIEQFITKPIDHDNMLSILYKVCTKINHKDRLQIQNNRIIFDDTSYYDKEKGAFYHDNKLIKLTKNELLFLKLVSENVEKIYSNEELMHFFEYEGVLISKDNIRSLVAKLRKKLPINCIESVYGVGYKLFIPLEETILTKDYSS
jgi:DNA-binding response OmpR family regulator